MTLPSSHLLVWIMGGGGLAIALPYTSLNGYATVSHFAPLENLVVRRTRLHSRWGYAPFVLLGHGRARQCEDESAVAGEAAIVS